MAYFLLPLGQKVRRLAGRDPPVYSDEQTFGENHFWVLEAFSAERARKRKVDTGTLIHAVLRKEMDLVKELCG